MVEEFFIRRSLAKIGVFSSDIEKLPLEKIEAFLVIANEIAKIDQERMKRRG